MTYDDHNSDDLITNESFISWVISANSNSKGSSGIYTKASTVKPYLIEQARELVAELNRAKSLPNTGQKEKMLDAIYIGIDSTI